MTTLETLCAMPTDELEAFVAKLDTNRQPFGVVGSGPDAVAFGEPFTFLVLVDALDVLNRRKLGMPPPDPAAKEALMRLVWDRPW